MHGISALQELFVVADDIGSQFLPFARYVATSQSLVTAEWCRFGTMTQPSLWTPPPHPHPQGSWRTLPVWFHYGEPLLMVIGAAAHLCFVLGGEFVHHPSSGQDHQGVPRHVPELKGKRPVEKHDEHTVDPLEDGGGVLQDEALLAEEDSTWRSEVKENPGTMIIHHRLLKRLLNLRNI